MSYGFVCVPKNLKHVLRGSKRGANLDDAQDSSVFIAGGGFAGFRGDRGGEPSRKAETRCSLRLLGSTPSRGICFYVNL